jgi:beta-glucosidase-like glycosyl hydrolase
MQIGAFITDCDGLSLSQAERDFIRRTNPWGFILFRRNCESPEQIKALTADFRATFLTCPPLKVMGHLSQCFHLEVAWRRTP